MMDKDTPILCIVGPSGSGKTTLMEGLIQELSNRGYRVATIKRTHHAVELDQPGKDSWRHRKAGATLAIICSPGSVAVFSDVEQELTVDELYRRFIQEADLILAEGYKDSHYPKIVVVGKEGWDVASVTGVKAVVSDQRLDLPACADRGVPVFSSAAVAEIATYLEEAFLRKR